MGEGGGPLPGKEGEEIFMTWKKRGKEMALFRVTSGPLG
jgi:hypothetical protein